MGVWGIWATWSGLDGWAAILERSVKLSQAKTKEKRTKKSTNIEKSTNGFHEMFHEMFQRHWWKKKNCIKIHDQDDQEMAFARHELQLQNSLSPRYLALQKYGWTLWDGWSYSYTWNYIRLYMIILVSLPMQLLSISFYPFLSHFSSLRHRHNFGGKLWKLWESWHRWHQLWWRTTMETKDLILDHCSHWKKLKGLRIPEKIPDPKKGPNHGEGMWRTPSKNKTWREKNLELIWSIQKMDIFDDVRWC